MYIIRFCLVQYLAIRKCYESRGTMINKVHKHSIVRSTTISNNNSLEDGITLLVGQKLNIIFLTLIDRYISKHIYTIKYILNSLKETRLITKQHKQKGKKAKLKKLTNSLYLEDLNNFDSIC